MAAEPPYLFDQKKATLSKGRGAKPQSKQDISCTMVGLPEQRIYRKSSGIHLEDFLFNLVFRWCKSTGQSS
jgi:hypothetical protein